MQISSRKKKISLLLLIHSITQSWLLISLLLTTATFAEIQTNDEGYHEELVKNTLKKADHNKDKKVTPDDKKSWSKYETFDTDGNKVISPSELLSQVDSLYPDLKARAYRNVVYKKVEGELLLLDIYYPLVKHFEHTPVFYYTHGGGWASGAKEPSGRDIKPLFEELLKNGVACVTVKYRLVKMWRDTDSVRIRDCIVDCQDGLRFLKKNETELGLDMGNVVVFGQSAGGHIAQLLTWSGNKAFTGDPALASHTVQPVAGISWFGPADFRNPDLFIPPEGVKKNYSADHWANRITKSSHIYQDKDAETLRLLKEVSPVAYLTQDSAPLMHIHGDVDNVIPVKHAYLLAEKAKEFNLPIRVEIVNDAAHGWWNKNSNPAPAVLSKITTDYVLKNLGSKK